LETHSSLTLENHQVRINDLAAPPEKIHPLIFIEPFVAVLIVVTQMP